MLCVFEYVGLCVDLVKYVYLMLIDVINVFVNGLVDVVLLWELFVSMLVLW